MGKNFFAGYIVVLKNIFRFMDISAVFEIPPKRLSDNPYPLPRWEGIKGRVIRSEGEDSSRFPVVVGQPASPPFTNGGKWGDLTAESI